MLAWGGDGAFLTDGAVIEVILLGIVVTALWTVIGVAFGSVVPNQVAAIVVLLAVTQFVEPIARVALGAFDATDSVARFLPGAAADGLIGASLIGEVGGGHGRPAAAVGRAPGAARLRGRARGRGEGDDAAPRYRVEPGHDPDPRRRSCSGWSRCWPCWRRRRSRSRRTSATTTSRRPRAAGRHDPASGARFEVPGDAGRSGARAAGSTTTDDAGQPVAVVRGAGGLPRRLLRRAAAAAPTARSRASRTQTFDAWRVEPGRRAGEGHREPVELADGSPRRCAGSRLPGGSGPCAAGGWSSRW